MFAKWASNLFVNDLNIQHGGLICKDSNLDSKCYQLKGHVSQKISSWKSQVQVMDMFSILFEKRLFHLLAGRFVWNECETEVYFIPN